MSKEYSYNKKKLKSRQGRAIYGLLGQQLGGLGAVVAGGAKGNILGRYAVGSVAGMGAGYLAGAHLPISDNGSLDYTVERAIKHYKKTGKKNATFRDLEKNYDLKLSKQASLENFYMLKVAGEDSFFTKVKAGWAASQHYSPKDLKKLKSRGYIVRPKGSLNKRARDEAYYTYLMAKEASSAVKRDPAKWEAAKRKAKARMGGKHSARAMQLAVKIYKSSGGTYAGKKPSSSSNSLKRWTKQKWQWSGGDKKGKGVYLPKRSASALKSTRTGRAKLKAAVRNKSKATRAGIQFSSHGLHVGKKR